MKWFVLLSILIFSNPALSIEKKRLNYGIKAGAIISSFWGNGIDNFEKNLTEQVSDFDSDQLFTFTAGGFISYDIISSFWAIQSELQYLRLGKKWDFDLESGEDVSFKIFTDYLCIPVLFKLLIPLESPIIPSVYAGPAFFLQLRSRAENLSSVPATVQREFLRGLGSRHNISNQVSNFDFGFSTGLSLNFLTGPGSIELDFRFGFGAVNTFTTSGAQDIRNSSFAIMIGFGFNPHR